MSESSASASFEHLNRVRLALDETLRDVITHAFGVDLKAQAEHVDGGEECAIWRVGDLVVRVSPTWRTDEQLRWTHGLALHVARSVPEAVAPLRTIDGTTYVRHLEHPVSLFPYVAGDILQERTPWFAAAAGALAARVHRAMASWAADESCPIAIGRAGRVPLPSELVDADLDRWHEDLSTSDAPRGPIHGDVYRRNLLVRDGRIVALLDWDEAHEDFIGQEIAWTMWEFAKIDGVSIDTPLARTFLDGYVGAGGLLPPGLESDAVKFIRWRLRDELWHQVTARARGEPVDERYFESELIAFRRLRDVVLHLDTTPR